MKFEIEMPELKVDDAFVKKLNLPKIMTQECLNTRTRLLKEVNQGRGADGESLRPYSKPYEKFKASTGRSASPSNLNFTGELHRSMHITAATDAKPEANVSFQGMHKGEVSNAALAANLYKMGFRGWFQFGKADRERIRESVMKAIDRNIKRLIDLK